MHNDYCNTTFHVQRLSIGIINDDVVGDVRVERNWVVDGRRVDSDAAAVVRDEVVRDRHHPGVLDEDVDDAGNSEIVVEQLQATALDVVWFKYKSWVVLANVLVQKASYLVVRHDVVCNMLQLSRPWMEERYIWNIKSITMM